MKNDSRIFIAGHTGLVGSALCRRLYEQNGDNHVQVMTHEQLDLENWGAVQDFFRVAEPEYVFLAAAKVGGIAANETSPADFIRANLKIQTNVIEAAFRFGVKRLLFFGSACAYPKMAKVPVQEEDLLTGELEETNRAYAIAKIAGIEMCDAYNRQHGCQFISCMPTNLYGIGDHYDLENSHVLPGMIRRIHEAKMAGAESVTLWGTGTPTREFLFADDLAEAAEGLMGAKEPPRLANITSGRQTELKVLAERVAGVVGFEGQVIWDTSRPDGTPCRALDGTLMSNLGWTPRTSLEEGLILTYKDFVARGCA